MVLRRGRPSSLTSTHSANAPPDGTDLLPIESPAGGRRCVQQRAMRGGLQRARRGPCPCARAREVTVDATGSARRCEPPPHPAHAGIDERTATRSSAAGPRGLWNGHPIHELRAAAMSRHAEETVAQAAPKEQWPRRKVCRGRRRFAPAQPAGGTPRFVGRRDENVGDAAPRAARLTKGKRRVALALRRPCNQTRGGPALRLHRVVRRLLGWTGTTQGAVARRVKSWEVVECAAWLSTSPESRLSPMTKNTVTHASSQLGHAQSAPSEHATDADRGTTSVTAADEAPCPAGHPRGSSAMRASAGASRNAVSRGLSESVATLRLRDAIWRRSLVIANRFRVIRTIDVAATCFAERPFKAALTAAQRAVRGMVKAKLLARYRTDRFQTVYGITARGAAWLQEVGVDAASSVRRVSDMRNPEHRLWLQFLVLACEARGIRALTESEVLRLLNGRTAPGQPMIQGLLAVSCTHGGKTVRQNLRPDAIAYEPDGATWFEADISKRGAGREAALAALAASVGRLLPIGVALRTVVVFCKTERIRKRALGVLEGLGLEHNAKVLVGDRTHFRRAEQGVFEVWRAEEEKLADGRTQVVDRRMGHVIVQALPTWLPKLRVEEASAAIAGWFSDGLLPYRRPSSLPGWSPCSSPLVSDARLADVKRNRSRPTPQGRLLHGN